MVAVSFEGERLAAWAIGAQERFDRGVDEIWLHQRVSDERQQPDCAGLGQRRAALGEPVHERVEDSFLLYSDVIALEQWLELRCAQACKLWARRKLFECRNRFAFARRSKGIELRPCNGEGYIP